LGEPIAKRQGHKTFKNRGEEKGKVEGGENQALTFLQSRFLTEKGAKGKNQRFRARPTQSRKRGGGKREDQNPIFFAGRGRFLGTGVIAGAKLIFLT